MTGFPESASGFPGIHVKAPIWPFCIDDATRPSTNPVWGRVVVSERLSQSKNIWFFDRLPQAFDHAGEKEIQLADQR